ncbi:MAG: thioredoxin-like domain-containing protein [Bacteroidales bacterium]|jgi:thiol-disulfide isomerase/thioredoxin
MKISNTIKPAVFGLLFVAYSLCAQNILKLKINNCPFDKVYLSSIYGYEVNRIDSALKNSDFFIFNNLNKISTGVYRISFNDSVFIDFIYNNESVSLNCRYPLLIENTEILESRENAIFFDYLKKKVKLNHKTDSLFKKFHNGNEFTLYHLIDSLNLKFHKNTEKIIKENPGKFASKILKTMQVPLYTDTSAYKLSYKEKNNFLQTHFFDNIDFNDTTLLHSELIYLSCKNYFEKVINQITSENFIEKADMLLLKANENTKVFCYILNLLLDEFIASDYKTVYIHLFQNYYLTNKACYSAKYGLITSDNDSIKIDFTKAPNIIANDTAGKSRSLYALKAKLILIFFWSPSCEDCEKDIPAVETLSEIYSQERLTIFSFAFEKDKDLWLKSVSKIKRNWIFVSDLKGIESDIAPLYKLKKTPTYELLDENKNIIFKTTEIKEMLKEINQRMGEKKKNNN